MRITVPKKTIFLVIIGVLLLVSLLLLMSRIRLLTWQTSAMVYVSDIESFETLCESTDCILNKDSMTQVFEIDNVTGIESEGDMIFVRAQLWNPKDNQYHDIEFRFEKKLVDNIGEFYSSPVAYPFTLELVLEEKFLPKIIFLNGKIFITNYKLYRVNLASNLSTGDGLDFEIFAQDIYASLREEVQEDDLGVEIYFEKGGVLSRIPMPPDNRYLTVLLLEIRGAAEKMKAEQLQGNCQIFKKYFPSEECKFIPYGPYETEMRFRLEKVSPKTREERYTPEELLGYVVLGDREKALEIRNDLAVWGERNYEEKIWKKRVKRYVDFVLDYIYYSELDCSDSSVAALCEEVYNLYNYSRDRGFDGGSGSLGFCSQISYLPRLSAISDEKWIAEEISYILDNYPFDTECTHSGGGEGLCAFDLDERVSCMEFLSDSLIYFEQKEETRERLEILVKDTIVSYWREFPLLEGLWGKEDSGILLFAEVGESLFPVRYFDYFNNYTFYKILEQNLVENKSN